jgi:predicted transcriptional regulator
MDASIREYLDREMACENLLGCLFGLGDLDRAAFAALVRAEEAMTVDDVAAAVGRERSTAYRSVQRLHDAGIVERDQRNYDGGSYCHVYRARPADDIADDMQQLLNRRYDELDGEIRDFRERHAHDSSEAVDVAVE